MMPAGRNNLGVAIIVDQKWRDLPGAAALAVRLQEHFGVSAELLPYARWRETLVLRRPGVVVLTHANGSRNRAIVECARSIGTRVAIIQTEGRPNNLYTMDYIVGTGVQAEGVDLWFAWGPVVRDFMLSRKVLPPEKIVVAGAHRFDFYRAPLRDLVDSRTSLIRRFGLDLSRPIVSLATNFTTAEAHTDRAKGEFLRRDWADLGLSRYPAYADPADFARQDYRARERTLDIVRALLVARPHIQLLVKPHPAEAHRRYRAFVDECRQSRLSATFVGLDYIWNLVSAVDVHIHRLCTTGVEAWFTNVPSIDLHMEDYHGWSLQLEGAASEAALGHDHVRDTETLVARVDHYLNGGAPTPEQLNARERYIARWLYRVDGQRCAAHAHHLAALAGRASVRKPALHHRARVLARRALTRTFGDPWGAERGLFDRGSQEDQLGQVDCRIASRDSLEWQERVRPLLSGQRLDQRATDETYVKTR